MKIYALLVGINHYNNIGRLKGCVNDIEKIEHYLHSNFSDFEIIKLTDEQALKPAIITAFGDIGTHISKEDVFLFYFCGHGTLEHADDIWNETNGLLECIVCHDEEFDVPSSFLLADKELRYLIFQLSKKGCHIVTIFDCCHSAGNTRNFKLMKTAPQKEVYERRFDNVFPMRNWEQFIFHAALEYNSLAGSPVNSFLPQGPHIQIAACEFDESAIEENREGVFTKALLHVLNEAGNNISYSQLRSRIRQRLRFIYEQQPRIYVFGLTDEDSRQLLSTKFLNSREADEGSLITEAVKKGEEGWLLNLGAIHGITASSDVTLIDPLLPDKVYKASVAKIFIDHALIQAAGNHAVPRIYTLVKAKVSGLDLKELKLYLHETDVGLDKRKVIIEKILNFVAGHFVLTDNEALADYCLHVTSQYIYITHPHEHYRPLVEPVELSEIDHSNALNKLSGYLKHISRWAYAQQLQNKDATNVRDQVKVNITQVFPDGSEKAADFEHNDGGVVTASLVPFSKSNLRIHLTNQTGTKLFIAAAYLSFDFLIYTHLLEGETELIYPGKTAALHLRSPGYYQTKESIIPLTLPDVIQEYNWPFYIDALKIFVSDKEFDIEALNLDPLPGPFTIKDQNRPRQALRSFDITQEEPLNLPWRTQTVHLKYPNIFYKKVALGKIEEMMKIDKMTFFAEGLYGDIKECSQE